MKLFRSFSLILVFASLVLIGTRCESRCQAGKFGHAAAEMPCGAEAKVYDDGELGKGLIALPPLTPSDPAPRFALVSTSAIPPSHVGEVEHEPPERAA